MKNPDPGELPHERTLAERVALIRLVLTVSNFAIVWLEHTVCGPGTPTSYTQATAAAALFLAYAGTAWGLLKRKRISLDRYFALSPILDVGFAALLVLATDGYLSPFHLWFVLAVVNSGFSRSPRLPLLTAALALAAHCLIALIPQAQPLHVSVLAVRSVYLFGVAAVLSSINFHLAKEFRALGVIAEADRAFSGVMTRSAAGRVLLARLMETLSITGARLRFADGTCLERGVPEAGHPAATSWTLQIAGRPLGTLAVYRRTPLAGREEAVACALCDRAASALLRIQVSEQLVAATRAEERLRIADELHDTYLQTLAALDLRAEAASRLVGGADGEVAAELQAIKQISHQAAAEIRRTLTLQSCAASGPGPAALRQLVSQRWPGQAEVQIPPDLALSGCQWRIVEMMVKEGLNNARKHAGAERVTLRLYRFDRDQVACSLENDGRPLPPQPAPGYARRLRNKVDSSGWNPARGGVHPSWPRSGCCHATDPRHDCRRSRDRRRSPGTSPAN